MSCFPLTKGNCKYRVWASGRRCAFAIQRRAGPLPPRLLLGKWVTIGRSALQGRLSSLEDRAPHPRNFLGHSDPLSPLWFPTPPLNGPWHWGVRGAQMKGLALPAFEKEKPG